MRLFTSELVKKYKSRTVVDHVSIDVNQGEIVGLLGPNGAGKTTTFYMIVGLITPNEGKIFLENDERQTIELTDEPVYRRAQMGVGYLAQEASVFRRLSVEDNIRAVLEMTSYSKEYQAERCESLIEEFRLQKVRKSLGIQLSGGERRRTEIARAVAINPAFILLDEPFAGVDPIAVEDIQSIVALPMTRWCERFTSERISNSARHRRPMRPFGMRRSGRPRMYRQATAPEMPDRPHGNGNNSQYATTETRAYDIIWIKPSPGGAPTEQLLLQVQKVTHNAP